jgi:hypothetical protein
MLSSDFDSGSFSFIFLSVLMVDSLKVDKIWRTSEEESTIRTDKKINENDPESKSLESIEPPPQDHGNDTCFLEPVPEKAQPFEERESEMSKSIELKVDKIWRASEEESTIRTVCSNG